MTDTLICVIISHEVKKLDISSYLIRIDFGSVASEPLSFLHLLRGPFSVFRPEFFSQNSKG